MQERVHGRIPRTPIVGLDLLRGIAALLVFLGHVRESCFVEFGALPPEQHGLLTRIFFGMTRTGHEAVLVFFVLSGYLVGGQIINHVREGRFEVANYALERTTRIFIPLIPACLLAVALRWVDFGEAPDWPQTLLNMVGLNGVLTETLSGNAPLWTLAYEIWFYILAGAIGYLLSARRGLTAAFLLIALSVAVFCILDARYSLFWAMGAVCVLLSGQTMIRSLGVIGFAFLAFGILDYQLAAQSKSFVNVVILPTPVAEALIVLGVCLIIPYLSDPRTDSALGILRKSALYLSSISYSLYLFHYPLNVTLDRIFPRADNLSWSAVGMFIVRVALILLVINVLYFAFEANTPAVRRYLRKRFLISSRDAA
jgi:peptidoglycan/LPS O-acetylase OafA/YrhL